MSRSAVRGYRAAAAAAITLAASLAVGMQALTVQASTAPGLGTAAAYAVLAGTPNITNAGITTISGSVGIKPAAALTGFSPCPAANCVNQTNGTIEPATAAAGKAKADLSTAYDVARSSPCNFNKTGQNLGGLTLTPGTYCQTTAPTLTGNLTLSGNGVFIFQVGSTLVGAPASSVTLTNGAQACNVFWQVSSSATLNSGSSFVGTIMALTSIQMKAAATLRGRALAQNGNVTLINNTITRPPGCLPVTVAGPSPTPVASRTPAGPTATPGLPAAGAPQRGAGDSPWWAVCLALGALATAVAGAARLLSRRA